MRRLAAAALALACACSRAAAPQAPAARGSKLGAALRQISSAPACAKEISSSLSASLPVPDETGARWKVFFYLAEPGPDRRFLVSGPAGESAFDLAGKIAYCRRLPRPAKRLGLALGPALKGLPVVEIERRRDALAARLETAAAAYGRRGSIGSEAKALLAEFRVLEEPPLAEEYRKLNPAFWAWLETQAR